MSLRRSPGPRKTAHLVVPAILLLGIVSGCASPANAPRGPSAVAANSGAEVPATDEIAALCAEIVKQGLTQQAADALAAASGYVTRVGSIDGTPQPTTRDYNPSRMTFDVAGGIVTGCSVG